MRLRTFFILSCLLIGSASAFVTMDNSVPVKRYIYTIKECDSLNDSELVKDCRSQFPPSGKFDNPSEHLTIEDVDDSTPARVQPRKIDLRVHDTSIPGAPKTAGDHLVSAGTHWMFSLGLGAAAIAFGALNDWDIHDGKKVLLYGILAGSAGFQIAVPIDLIMAGHALNAKK